MADDSPPVHKSGNRIVYRASSIGGCPIMLAAARQEQTKQEPRGKIAEVFQAGNEAEEAFFEKHRKLAVRRQQEVVLDITPTIKVVGHVDAHTDEYVVEVKSQSDKEWEKWDDTMWETSPLWKKYGWQISACMLAAGGEPGLLIRVNRTSGEYRMHKIAVPFHTKEEIMARILEVEVLALEDRLVCENPDFFCPYPYLHKGLEPVDDPDLEKLVAEYVGYKKQVDLLRSEQEIIRKQILEKLEAEGGYGDKVLLMNGSTVTRSSFIVEPHMVQGGPQTRLTVKEAT